MELLFAAIVIGIFMLIAVWLKYYLDELSKHAQTASSTEKKKSSSAFFRYSVIQGAVTLISLIFCLYEVESIVITGPILGLIGFIVAWLAKRSKLKIGILIGLSAPSISLSCLLIIVGFDLSPMEAQGPVSAIISVYTVLLALILPIYTAKFRILR